MVSNQMYLLDLKSYDFPSRLDL